MTHSTHTASQPPPCPWPQPRAAGKGGPRRQISRFSVATNLRTQRKRRKDIKRKLQIAKREGKPQSKRIVTWKNPSKFPSPKSIGPAGVSMVTKGYGCVSTSTGGDAPTHLAAHTILRIVCEEK